MKRILSILALVFVAVAVVGCGSAMSDPGANEVPEGGTLTATPPTGVEETASSEPTEVAQQDAVKVEKAGFSQAGDEICWGVVLNNRADSADAINATVTVNFVAADDTIIGTETQNINVIPAGQRYYSGGSGYINGSGRAKTIEAMVDVDTYEAGDYPLPEASKVRLYWEQYLGYGVAGQVTNNLDSALSSGADITAVLFDARGRVVGGGFAYLDADLAPGRRASFKMLNGPSVCKRGMVKSVRVSVENEVAY